jgi:suppressor of ftsI
MNATRLLRLMRHLLWLLPAIAISLAGPATTARTPEASVLTELRSSGGVLAVTLTATEGHVRLGELELDGATYNGLYAGPVLRVQPGDQLRIRLVNHLSQPTNLHFHGIQASPLGNSDNAHIAVAPGDTFDYQVDIPITQPPGLYWYHSHIHGLSEKQVMSGLSGALVVERPAGSSLSERLFVLKDMTFEDDTGSAEVDEDLHGIVQSVNGDLDTDLSMRPDEIQLWRFSNQSADRAFHIALTGHRFRIVAEDGEATIGERSTDALDIMPSARVEVLVDGGEAGNFELLSKGVMTGLGDARTPDRVLGHLVVAGERVVPAAAVLPAPAPADLRRVAIDARRDIVFSQTNTLKAGAQRYFVNGRAFDANRNDIRVALGNVEEWTVRNDTDDMHVFHIHQLGFQVVEINGSATPFTGRVDTVRVPERGEVKLRMAFTDRLILGRFMFHCHVLSHEDKGMMGQVEVYDPLPQGFLARMNGLRSHLWWWLHGVPWSQCGLADT